MSNDDETDWTGREVDFDASGCLIIKDPELARRVYARLTGTGADTFQVVIGQDLLVGMDPIHVPQGPRANECPKGDRCCPNFQCTCHFRSSYKPGGGGSG